jgi:hypothetical protein
MRPPSPVTAVCRQVVRHSKHLDIGLGTYYVLVAAKKGKEKKRKKETGMGGRGKETKRKKKLIDVRRH